MDEYITKQEARFAMLQRAWEPNEWHDIKSLISSIPPADVRPVVPGKWEVVDWVEYDGHGECVHYPKEGLCCTNCKNAFKKKLLCKDNYCPNCGADMKEETKK